MEALVYLLGYLICCCVSFYFFQLSWRYNFDFRQSDLVFILLLSLLGPAGLIPSLFIWLIESPKRSKNGDKIIWRKK